MHLAHSLQVMLLNFDPSFVSTCSLPDHISRIATGELEESAAGADYELALQPPFKRSVAHCCCCWVAVRIIATSTHISPHIYDCRFDDDGTKWARQVGVRVRRTVSWLKNPSTRPTMFVVAVVLRAFQYPFHSLLQASTDRNHASTSATRPVPLLDHLWEPASPSVVVQQYLGRLCSSSLLAGPLRMTCAGEGGALGASTAWLAFRLVMVGASGLYARLQFGLKRWPLKLFACCDVRASADHRRQIALEFERAQQCCLCLWDGQPLHRLVADSVPEFGVTMADALLSSRWQQVLRTCVSEIDLNTADLENAHAFAKRSSSYGSSVELMAATCLLRSARSVALSARVSLEKRGQAGGPSAAPEGATSPESKGRFRSWTALHFVHWMRARQAPESYTFGPAVRVGSVLFVIASAPVWVC